MLSPDSYHTSRRTSMAESAQRQQEAEKEDSSDNATSYRRC